MLQKLLNLPVKSKKTKWRNDDGIEHPPNVDSIAGKRNREKIGKLVGKKARKQIVKAVKKVEAPSADGSTSKSSKR